MIFGKVAKDYYHKGLAPIPLQNHGTKRGKAAFLTAWQKCGRERPSIEELEEWINKYGDNNVGIACGTMVHDDFQIVAVDVDSEDFIEHVQNMLPSYPCGKKGKKGITYFGLVPQDIPNNKISNKESGMCVEFLSNGMQTVIPPSIHPETDREYEWIGESLLDINLRLLPIIYPEYIWEIKSIANGKGQYFIGGELEDGTTIPGLNYMTYNGVGGGGDTHEMRLRAIGHMVAQGWSDEAIIARIKTAQKKAVQRFGDVFDWPDCERSTQRKIEDAKKKDFGQAKKAKKIPIERQMANWLRDIEFKNVYPKFFEDEIYYFKDGYYKVADKKQLESKLLNVFDSTTAPVAANATNTFTGLVYTDNFGKNADSKICLENGILDIESLSLIPPDPNFEINYKLDVAWNDESKCEKYDSFLDWVFGGDEDSIRCFNEFAGLTFVNNMSFQKMLFLLGEGANGKSTLAQLLEKIHHPKFVTNQSVSSLDDDRVMYSMKGKLLNISSEQSVIKNISEKNLKQLTGGDSVSVRALYKESIVMRPTVRFLCLANSLPGTSDVGVSFRRRIMILKCPNVIPEGERNPELINEILEEKEGIFAKWMQSYKNLLKRKRFIEPKSSAEEVEKYVSINNPVGRYMMEKTLVCDPERGTELSVLEGDIKKFVRDTSSRPYFTTMLMSQLEKEGIKTKVVTTPSGTRTTMVGLRIEVPASSTMGSFQDY